MSELATHQDLKFDAIIEDDDIREEIPNDLFPLLDFFRKNNWSLKINSDSMMNVIDEQITVIHAETEDWNGLFIHQYKIGYITSYDKMTQAIRKLAELCLRLKETFTDTLPSIYIKDSYIYPDNEWHTEAKKGKLEALNYLRKKFNEEEDSTLLDDTFSKIKTGDVELLMSSNIVSRLMKTIEIDLKND